MVLNIFYIIRIIHIYIERENRTCIIMQLKYLFLCIYQLKQFIFIEKYLVLEIDRNLTIIMYYNININYTIIIFINVNYN